jgi:hypothetical protein
MRYIFSSRHIENLEDYNNKFVRIFTKLNEVARRKVNFTSNIKMQDDIIFEDEFSKIIGTLILNSLNEDFQWNLFLRILFEFEPESNEEDFISFISFLKDRFTQNRCYLKLYNKFNEAKSEDIKNSFIREIALCFKDIDSIQFVYDNNIEEINGIVDYFINKICEDIDSYEEWKSVEDIYHDIFKIKVYAIFGIEVKMSMFNELIENIKNRPCKIELGKRILKLLDKLEDNETIKSEEAAKFFRV